MAKRLTGWSTWSLDDILYKHGVRVWTQTLCSRARHAQCAKSKRCCRGLGLAPEMAGKEYAKCRRVTVEVSR